MLIELVKMLFQLCLKMIVLNGYPHINGMRNIVNQQQPVLIILLLEYIQLLGHRSVEILKIVQLIHALKQHMLPH